MFAEIFELKGGRSRKGGRERELKGKQGGGQTETETERSVE